MPLKDSTIYLGDGDNELYLNGSGGFNFAIENSSIFGGDNSDIIYFDDYSNSLGLSFNNLSISLGLGNDEIALYDSSNFDLDKIQADISRGKFFNADITNASVEKIYTYDYEYKDDPDGLNWSVEKIIKHEFVLENWGNAKFAINGAEVGKKLSVIEDITNTEEIVSYSFDFEISNDGNSWTKLSNTQSQNQLQKNKGSFAALKMTAL